MIRNKVCVLILVTVLMLSGCTQMQAGQALNEGESPAFTARDENFEVKTYIDKLELEENEEIKVYSTIEYIGENDSIKIWSGEPYFHHMIYDGKKYINDSVVLDVLKETVLKKGEVYTMPFSKSGGFTQEDPDAKFWEQYFSEKELKLPAGDYTFTATTDFWLDAGLKEEVTLKTEFKVKVR